MSDFSWPQSFRSAVSLTFDDARESQLDTGIPLLSDYDARATFYISPEHAERRLQDWRGVAAAGHEIGNHSLTHPCSESFSFSCHNGLEDYDLNRMAGDIDGASEWIAAKLDVTPRSFAYPCGLIYVGRGRANRSYVPLVAERFLAGRAFGIPASVDPRQVDLAHVWSHDFDRMAPEQAVAILEEAREKRRWAVFTGHDIAENTRQAVPPATLRAILSWIRAAHREVWLDTFAAIAEHIQNQRSSCLK